MRPLLRSPIALVVAVLLCLVSATPDALAVGEGTTEMPRWRWPIAGPRVIVEPFRAPAHAYGAGHRGVDLGAAAGASVVAPADGTVAFRGRVVDRPLLTIEHAGGLVTTFEPVRSSLEPGDVVTSGQEIGIVDVGGHTPSGALHLGVRREGEYINPMLLFGEVPRAVLLPCCGPG